MKTAWLLAATLIATPALADEDDLGELNPEELTLKSYVQRAAEGKADIVTCMQGYFATKSGKHDWANTIFETCTDQGFTASMHWRSYMAPVSYTHLRAHETRSNLV